MKQQVKENYLGVGGWIWAGRYQIERYLYFLHRITGLGLLLYAILHMLVMIVIRGLLGQEAYEALMNLFNQPIFKAGEYLVFGAFIFHGLNGLRLILQELGFILGKPKPPVYPYKDSLRQKRPVVLVMIAMVIVFSLITLFAFIGGGY